VSFIRNMCVHVSCDWIKSRTFIDLDTQIQGLSRMRGNSESKTEVTVHQYGKMGKYYMPGKDSDKSFKFMFKC